MEIIATRDQFIAKRNAIRAMVLNGGDRAYAEKLFLELCEWFRSHGFDPKMYYGL
jgi:hypothetical protein